MGRVRYVGLLRGINLGPNNRIKMPELQRLFVESGAEDVTTFIQSGNVLFSADEDSAAAVFHSVKKAIAAHLNKPIPVVFRSLKELELAVQSNPFFETSANTENLFAMFLETLPTTEQLQALDPNRSPGDEYRVVGREVFYKLTNHAAETKLTNAYFDSKLKTISTARNWRTTIQLLELLKGSVQ